MQLQEHLEGHKAQRLLPLEERLSLPALGLACLQAVPLHHPLHNSQVNAVDECQNIRLECKLSMSQAYASIESQCLLSVMAASRSQKVSSCSTGMVHGGVLCIEAEVRLLLQWELNHQIHLAAPKRHLGTLPDLPLVKRQVN